MFRTTISKSLPVSRALASSGQYLHSTPNAGKTVKEKVSEVADAVNKKVGKGLASAIDSGEKVASSAKEVFGSAVEKTKGKVEKAEEKAEELRAGARGDKPKK